MSCFGCEGKHPNGENSCNDTWLCQPCVYKLVDAGKIQLKNGSSRSLGSKRNQSSDSRSSRKFTKKAYAVRIVRPGSTPTVGQKNDGKKSTTEKGISPSKRSSHGVNPRKLFVGGGVQRNARHCGRQTQNVHQVWTGSSMATQRFIKPKQRQI